MVAGLVASARRVPGPVALSVVLTAIVTVLGRHGTDVAAQAYRVNQLHTHGLQLWNVDWFGGNFPLGYSVLTPPIGALIGLAATGILFAGAATWAFDRIVRDTMRRRRWGCWSFAVSAGVQVAVGQVAFLSGETFALLGVLALLRRRRLAASALLVMSALCSGEALVFATIGVAAWALNDREQRWKLAAAIAPSVFTYGLIMLAFPGDGTFPFSVTAAAGSLGVCAAVLASPLRRIPVLRIGALLYSAFVVVAIVVPNPMGANTSRLATGVGVSIAVCGLEEWILARRERFVSKRQVWWHELQHRIRWILAPQRRRRTATVATVAVLGATTWQLAPAFDLLTPASASIATDKAYYQPLDTELGAQANQPIRVEVPPTELHWESVWVPTDQISLARGWDRQLDRQDNPLFYNPRLSAAAYHSWLIDNGISYVALPSTRLDYAGKPEASLLRHHQVPGLAEVWHTSRWTLWHVTDSPGLVSGPGTLTGLHGDNITLTATGPGTITLRVRYTRYLTAAGAASCTGPAEHGWTDIRTTGAGPVNISTDIAGGVTC